MSEPTDKELRDQLTEQLVRAKNMNSALGIAAMLHEITSSMCQIVVMCNDKEAAKDLMDAATSLGDKLELARLRNAAPAEGSPIH